MVSRNLVVRYFLILVVLGAVLGLPLGVRGVAEDDVSDTGPGAVATYGTASTTESGLTQGQALDQPPAMSPEIEQAIENTRNREPRQDPMTPIDPNAVLRSGPPTVPPTTFAEQAGPLGSGSVMQPNAPGTFQFYEIKDLGSGTGSLIPEPSHGSNDLYVLQAWNWYSAISSSGGRSWKYYNPATLFPNSYGGFCCDQVVYYDQSHDLMFWILQYSPNASNNNAIRVAWAKGTNALKNAAFCYTDFTPQQIGSPTGTNYDQPKFARSNNYYYLEVTQYGATGGSVVMRIAASQFNYPSCSGVAYNYYLPGLFSPGFVQRAYGTMYFAAHVSNTVLRVFSWPEGGSISSHDVTHTAYPQNYPYSCPRTGGSATSDWCQRRSFGGGWAHSDRIFTAWINGGVMTFMWDASQGTGGFGTFAYPYIHVARVNESTFALVNEPILWNSATAFQYSSAALNDRLHAAGTFMYGGGSNYQNCGAFIWDDYSSAPAPWEIYPAVTSDSDPNDTLSGDYLSARRNDYNPYSWGGTCYALKGGGNNSNVHTYYLWFGRQRDYRPWLSAFLPVVRK